MLCGAALLVAPLGFAQDDQEDEEIFELSPFTVEGSEDQGYRATSTLAGSRIRTDLKDVGSAISVITEEFLRDTGAVDNASLLQYTTSTEVGGIGGNFAGEERLSLLNPNANTRVRGLQAADNTRDYFLSDVPWDGYNVSRVDMQRGPNAILSGLGSPAGIINNTTDSANYTNEGEVQIRFGSHGSTRAHVNVNRVILEDELGVRVAAVKKDDKYRQEEAWAEDERFFVALKYEPKFLKTDNALTTFTGNFESGSINSNRPRTRPPVDRMSGFWNTFGDLPAQITGSPLAFSTTDAWLPTNQPLSFGAYPQSVKDAIYGDDAPYNTQGGLVYTEDGRPVLGSTPVSVHVRGSSVPTTWVEAGTGWNNDNPDDPNRFEVPIMREVPILNQISFNHPWYGENYTDGPVLYFANADAGDGNPTDMWIPGISSQDANVLTVDNGQIVRDLGGTGHVFYRSIMSPASTSAAARTLGLPLADIGVYNAERLWDRSIFDYKNHLLDGDNKREMQDFRVLNLKVAQTFFDNRLGFEAAINNEVYKYGQSSPFGWSPEITIDVNETLGDLVTPNPNVGRPVIFKRTQGSSNLNERERDGYRFTATAELREDDLFESDSFLGKLIGKQRLTALKSSDDITFYEMGFKNWLADDSFRAYQGLPGMADNTSEVMTAVYMGPSVIGTSGPQGLNLQPLPRLNPKGIDVINYWDNTWANPSTRNVDYLESQTWYHVWDEQYSDEQNNPGNYVGWTTRPIDILVDTEGDRLNLVTTARSQTEEVTSQAAVWQGFFWGGAIVGTYGVREDEVLKYNVTAPRIPDDPRNIFDPTGNTPFPQTGGNYLSYTPEDAAALAPAALGSVDRFEDDNESKSLVVHLDQFLPELPGNTKVSVFWNESSNFQPAETRVDHMNRTIAPPTGITEDYGFLIRSFDDRLSLKVTQYETLVNGATFPLRNLWYVGTAETSLFAAGMRDKAFLDGVPGWSDSWRGYANSPYQAGDAPWESYLAARGEASRDQTAEEAQAWQERALTNLEQNLAPQEFWDAWGATKSDARWQNGWWDPWSESTGAQPAGFTTTSDLLSEGTEFELTYNPVENWNIAFNASRTEAVRDNLAGSLKAWVDARNEIHNGDNGDIRLWWSGDRANTLKTRWNAEFYSSYQLALQQEGTNVDELREWRYNLVTNYNFRDGKFKGLGVGGSYRWQDEIVIGYPQSRGVTESGNEVVEYDITRPFYGPSEDSIDLWASYSVDLNDDITWRIQLNVRDVLADGGLIPLAVNPDGSITEYRLDGDPSWFLSNTFSF
ncbi:hypothetical protein IEN85_24155 [Pelagicoccus sp. NFK12]|uniref:TonB-dependent receptor plug domain-containing protein n=1 Tax=Pelagicoccus enzymogenes TaxID=2773457 RepID=A0A927FCJ1_9BACT|nr:TonB-dependent receptor plug domain-containing protein [Pelagicoccus enzymogenes]MBD5782612.1 hypothetical protein [Pelagicoccus enzymogenes]